MSTDQRKGGTQYETRQETLIMRLLSRARTIAVVSASPRAQRHSHTVVAHLHRVGYDVIPVRPDLQKSDGLKSFARLADIPVQLDLAVLFRRADAAPRFVAEAASKRVEAVWLPPGVWTPQAELQAREHTCPSSRIAASRKTIAICRKRVGILRVSESTKSPPPHLRGQSEEYGRGRIYR